MKAKIRNFTGFLADRIGMGQEQMKVEYDRRKEILDAVYVEKGCKDSEIGNVLNEWLAEHSPLYGCIGEQYRVNSDNLQTALQVASYVEEYGLKWDVMDICLGYALVSYGRCVTIAMEEMLYEIEEPADYSNVSISQLRNPSDSLPAFLPAGLDDETLSMATKKEDDLQTQLAAMEAREKDIESGAAEELSSLMEEIRKKELELEARKKSMMAELQREKDAMLEKINQLKKQIYVMEAEIYRIQCFEGKTVELLKLRNGRNAPDDTPFVLNQKLLYLDEDLSRLLSVYNEDIMNNYRIFEEAAKYSDELVDAFCHQEKCITFFKVSKDAKEFGYNDKGMVAAYSMLHGQKIGFLIRNGENLYCGWMEEEWKKDSALTFSEDFFLRSGSSYVSADGTQTAKSTPVGERVSRMFALSILQGLISRGDILNFPEPVSIMEQSRYIVFNYADMWLDDNRYGDFETIVRNLHHYNKVGDDILVVQRLFSDSKGERGIGYANRTHDCSVPSGLNRINLIEDGRYYVSAEKTWSECGARSNYELEKDEFMNLTYFNSLWMEYYIQTKKIGRFGIMYVSGSGLSGGHYDKMSYSYLIPFFRKALFFLRDREGKEKKMILPYYPELEAVPEWQVKLSNWKIMNKVRQITDYQAKRFAAYLEKGDFKEASHLFEKKWDPPKVEDLDKRYSSIELRDTGLFRNHMDLHNYSGYDHQHPQYGWSSRGDKYSFCNEKDFEDEELVKKTCEENYQKLLCIQEEVMKMVQEQNITDKDISRMFHDIVFSSKRDREDDVLKSALRSFCNLIDLHQPIPSYDDMRKDRYLDSAFDECIMQSKIRHWIPKADGVYPLIYYRTIQDSVLYTVNWGINWVLEERYKVEAK